jgi:hypothetical protein
MFGKGEYPHPGYIGDSLCGFGSHFGNQACTSNVKILSSPEAEPRARAAKPRHPEITVQVDGNRYRTGLRKFGAIIGDFAQVGCNTVTEPGALLAPKTVVYPLSRISAGCWSGLVKNKPLEAGVLERASLL